MGLLVPTSMISLLVLLGVYNETAIRWQTGAHIFKTLVEMVGSLHLNGTLGQLLGCFGLSLSHSPCELFPVSLHMFSLAG